MNWLKNLLKGICDKLHIPYDKALHFGVNVFLALFGIWYYSLGIGLSIGASLGKEYGDSKATGNKWSWSDIVADMLGLGVGLLLSWGIRKLIGR